MSDQQRWDVIVIGAGLGGMLAAAMLARRGRRVLVLERHAQVGGRLRSYDVDGYVIDAGAYLWPNLHLDRALAAAGATDFRGSQIPPTQVLRVFVQGREGRRWPFPWPGRGSAPALLDAADATLHADADTARGLAALWEHFAALSDAEVDALRHVPVRDALPRFAVDARVADAFRRNVMLFGSYDPDSADMAECIGLRRRALDAPQPKPECAGANTIGGVRALPLALRAALAASGAELRLGWEVDQIIVGGSRAVGVAAHECAQPFQQSFAAGRDLQRAGLAAVRSHRTAYFARTHRGGARRAVGGVVAAAFAFEGLPRCARLASRTRFRAGRASLLDPTPPSAAVYCGRRSAATRRPDSAEAGLSPHADRRYGACPHPRRLRAMVDEIIPMSPRRCAASGDG
jgi:phytoene dehydrogenase-like protein